MIKKIDSKKGILFFITGLSGSGKSTISKKIKNKIEKLYGPTIIISGEKIRNILRFYGYSKKERAEVGKKNINLINLILRQKINVIYDAIALQKVLRNIKRKKIKNYLEIYIKTNVKKIIKFNKKKKIYKKNKKNIVGIHIKPEFPTRPHILIKNDFNRNFDDICAELLNKIKNKIKK
tara:strand:+ start:66 stop:599 length:534 start_codon:yes stop_codon:yes gene_type:complete